MNIRFVTHEEVPRLPEQLAELSNLAFAEYEGAPVVDADFIRWYARRPGSTPRLCTAALDGDRLVANVLVAIQRLNIGGQFIPCGIIDTVATDPGYRKQGLAHRLMDMAHDLMRRHGAQAGVLYTNPANHPYRFYSRLGYLTRAQAALLSGPRPARAGAYRVRPMLAEEAEWVCEAVNGRYSSYEGFARLDDELWRWHRVERPAAMPAQVLVAERDGVLVGTAAMAEVKVVLEGQEVQVAVISDAVYQDERCLQDLAAAAPAGRLLALHDLQAPEHAALEQLGLQSSVGEVAMVLPLTREAEALLDSDPAPWYVMVESVVGV